MPAAAELGDLLWGSVVLRPYVYGFLALHLGAATAAWGWRRALGFAGLAAGFAFGAEFTSTRVGVPFGLYHYTGITRGQELYLANVPFFDPLSFTFLAWASLGLARLLLERPGRRAGPPSVLTTAVTTGGLMMWLDVVIDPLAVRGDRWFLGPIFFYPEPGWYFGVPLTNFAGWAVLGAAIAAVWLRLEPRLAGPVPGWAARVPGRRWHPVLVYYGVLAFNLTVTAAIGEPTLFWAGVAAHLPLAALVVFCVASAPRSMPDRTRLAGVLE